MHAESAAASQRGRILSDVDAGPVHPSAEAALLGLLVAELLADGDRLPARVPVVPASPAD